MIKRLLAGRCEVCGGTVDIQVHHVRKLADLDQAGQSRKNTWTKIMAKRRGKTLIVCADCHHQIRHIGEQAVANSVRVPRRPVEQPLYPVRRRVASGLGQGPAVLARNNPTR
ncbi:hypothetical protein [Micromonospora sp. MW-13]|uniref:HNH endonuclease n=1 Tax=Micromonospora sp. MW-13 TaxID=2094022 RepID=UPI001A9E529F